LKLNFFSLLIDNINFMVIILEKFDFRKLLNLK
jgi:hypothetical protein